MGKFSVINFLEENGHNYKETSSGRQVILGSCPGCRKSNKFYIETTTGRFICHKCASDNPEYKGGAIGLVMLLGGLNKGDAVKLVYGTEINAQIEYDFSDPIFKFNSEELEINPLITEFSGINRVKKSDDYPQAIKIPEFFRRIRPEDNRAWNYLISRGLNSEIINQSGALITPYPDFISGINHLGELYPNKSLDWIKSMARYGGRIIFPIKLNGGIFGFVARDFTGSNSLKVLNSSGSWRRHVLWNYDSIQPGGEMVVAEGIVSAMKCGIHRSVATLGKHVTNEQIGLIKRLNPKRVIIVPDLDAFNSGLDLRFKLAGVVDEVVVVRLPDRRNARGDFLDAGDYSVEEMEALIGAAIERGDSGSL